MRAQSTPADPFTSAEAVKLELNVNGQTRSATIEARTTLAEVLREDLNLTGTKVVCDRGACSCCTVEIDGQPVCSCLTLALDVDGREVTTIEGRGERRPAAPRTGSLRRARRDHVRLLHHRA